MFKWVETFGRIRLIICILTSWFRKYIVTFNMFSLFPKCPRVLVISFLNAILTLLFPTMPPSSRYFSTYVYQVYGYAFTILTIALNFLLFPWMPFLDIMSTYYKIRSSCIANHTCIALSIPSFISPFFLYFSCSSSFSFSFFPLRRRICKQ